jgi:hypothetical protein
MSIIDAQIRTITCDGVGCTKTVTFDQKDSKATVELPENAWMKTTRVTQTADGRNFTYCSDICEVKGVETGKHNVQEAPKIVQPNNANAVALAAKAAEAARQADQALREGQPTKVQLTD